MWSSPKQAAPLVDRETVRVVGLVTIANHVLHVLYDVCSVVYSGCVALSPLHLMQDAGLCLGSATGGAASQLPGG